MSVATFLTGIGIVLFCAEVALAEEVHKCFALQRELVLMYGPLAPSYYWYPRCLTGGYFQNVQCGYRGCHCAYVDTGLQIPNTIENAYADYMKENCPWLSEKVPNACSLPPADYPCKKTSQKFYFDAISGKCEANSRSCLGFDSTEACEESCVVEKKDRCNFKMANGRTCDRKDPGERWYHEETTGSCRLFLHNGCGGNSNNYKEKWICMKTCARRKYTELVIQVGNIKYIVSLPAWLVAQRNYISSATTELTVEEFKDIEGYMTEISKFPVKEEDKSLEEKIKEQKLRESEKYRPQHAPKNMSRSEICGEKKSPGPCRGFFTRWYFDEKQSKCIKFIYGGCFGNENRHKTATGCAAFCNAEIPPTDLERIQDLISSGGKIGGTDDDEGEDEKDNNDGSRQLGLGIKPATEVVVIGHNEVLFEISDEEDFASGEDE